LRDKYSGELKVSGDGVELATFPPPAFSNDPTSSLVLLLIDRLLRKDHVVVSDRLSGNWSPVTSSSRTFDPTFCPLALRPLNHPSLRCSNVSDLERATQDADRHARQDQEIQRVRS
jgi:hypothetical protein